MTTSLIIYPPVIARRILELVLLRHLYCKNHTFVDYNRGARAKKIYNHKYDWFHSILPLPLSKQR